MIGKSLEKTIKAYNLGYRIDKSGNVVSPYSGSIRKLQIASNGNYHKYVFGIRDAATGKRFVIDVHKLAAYQQFGSGVVGDSVVVRHLDGNSLNNAPLNIAIGSRSDNELDKPAAVRKRVAINASSKRRKYTDEEVAKIREYHSVSYKDTMDKFNISSKGTLHYILNNSNY